MKVIELETDRRRVEVVAGLVWHPLQGTGSARSREILAYAADSEADLKVLRGDEAPHVGLAKKAEGAKAGQISAAAVIADTLQGEGHHSVLVALRIPEEPACFLYIAVRDHVILADGDIVGTEQEISARLRGDKSFGGWDLVICPAEWGFADAQQREFDAFFTPDVLKKRGSSQLQELKVNVTRLALVAGIVAAVAAGSVYGWTTWQKKQALAAAVAEAQRLQAEQEAAHARRGDVADAVPVKPWPQMPSAPMFASACANAFARVGVTAGNWKLDGAACENGQLSVRWVKSSEAAWVSHLKSVRPNAVVAADGLSATVSVPVLAPASGEGGEPLQDPMGLRLRYFDLASRYGMAIKVDPPQAPPAPQVLPGQKAPSAAPPPLWAETAVQATVSFDPVEAAALLDSPGLRFTKLVFAFSKDGLPQYQFTGVQYVRP
jgi:Flp pilus assembly protein TadG